VLKNIIWFSRKYNLQYAGFMAPLAKKIPNPWVIRSTVDYGWCFASKPIRLLDYAGFDHVANIRQCATAFCDRLKEFFTNLWEVMDAIVVVATFLVTVVYTAVDQLSSNGGTDWGRWCCRG